MLCLPYVPINKGFQAENMVGSPMTFCKTYLRDVDQFLIFINLGIVYCLGHL